MIARAKSKKARKSRGQGRENTHSGDRIYGARRAFAYDPAILRDAGFYGFSGGGILWRGTWRILA
jgi:hypothetical protein